MKTQKVLKKLLSSILMAIIILGQFSAYHFTSIATVVTTKEGDSLNLKLSRTNQDETNPIGYGFGMDGNGGAGKVIWTFMSGDSNDSNYKYATNLYCIKAENGTTWERNQTQKVIYNRSYVVPLKENTESTVANEMLKGTYSNEILWIIDNMYIPGESTTEDFAKYLKLAGIEYITEEGGYVYTPSANHNYINIPEVSKTYADTVTEEDIVAIQQMAIWYYTNYGTDSAYNKLNNTLWLQETSDETNYTELADDKTSGRGPYAEVIYRYLVNEASRVATELKNAGKTYKLKNNTAKLWLSFDTTNGTHNEEQPVVEIHKQKEFDLVLRKAIVSLNDGKSEMKNTSGEDARRPLKEDKSIQTVDIKTSSDGATIAVEYNHRKDPIVVQKGDKVTYSITIYNEGKQSGYAAEIIDQLPGTAGALRLDNETPDTVTSSIGNTYKVGYSAMTNQITLTMVEDSTKYLIPAYNEDEKEISYETILLDCIVEGKPDVENQKVLTNIAYITKAFNADGVEVQDRDSQTANLPTQTASNLVTTDIGYTGNSNNPADLSKNDVYYEGQQDDDDFEKIVILPESFDLSLTKYITSIDDKEGNRLLTIDTSKLNTTDPETGKPITTADYNKVKEPAIVQNGSKIKYNISVYNEGSIDGIATIIKDQLPAGLKLNLDYEGFTKNGDTYITRSSKGHVYEVTYNQTTNLVTFTLYEAQTITYLKAYENGKTLDEDILTLECIVEAIADDTENTYLTNIAYIYQAKQKDGTVVEKQETGPDADRDSQPHKHPTQNKDELKKVGNDNNPSDLSQDDEDFEKIVLLPKTFDLRLIKYLSSVNDEKTANRILSVDTSKLNTVDANGKTITTAEYILEKNPVSVKAGDFVTYTFRVYNEGEYDGYATEISEDIPEGLEFIVVGDGQIWSWDGTTLEDITKEIEASEMHETILNINSNWGYKQDSSIITTTGLSEELIKAFGKENVEYADSENKIDYKEISVIFRVKKDVESNFTIKNEVAISADKAVDENNNEIDIPDRDSTPDEWKKDETDKKEDDEDYEYIVTKAFDLSLRKQIVQINDALYTKRFAKLDQNNQYANTLYDYYDVYSEKPKVKAGDIVTYSIRVYNEGEIDGYASLIADTLPSGLELVEYEKGDGSINDTYGWVLLEGTTYKTDYLSYEKDLNKGTEKSTIIKAYTGEGEASYQEVYIECRVKENATKADSLLNIAQIADDSDENGNPIKDKDSDTILISDINKWKEEEDLDIEIAELKEFDLALRKFITTIENGETTKQVTTRIPQVSYDKETGKITYEHPKDAFVVHVGDTVIYTIRVYNEGDIDGYASKVIDDIPEYLEYLPQHRTNIENEWVMYDKEGNKTDKLENATYICTEHLAKGKGTELEKKGANLIQAFDGSKQISETNPDFKEVKVAFKVKDPNSTEYEIVNFAKISEHTDENGNPIKDRDSDPNNEGEEPTQDDEDIEKVKVEYFDLALSKYITKIMVNENGEVRETLTGNLGNDNDIIPNVQINKKNINKTEIKFVYAIKVTNEGQIVGEATEITDYVPEGLVFKAEDNPNWKDEGNNVISTRQLMGIALQPGESAEVEVILTWVNGNNNLGAKENVAEISEDYNEENVPDKDSTPDNKKEEEDDIDEATVLISVNQGGGIPSIYRNISLIFLFIILVGGVIIKKFVL